MSVIRTHRELIALGLLLEAGLLALVALTGLDRGAWGLQVVFWLPFMVYLLAVWRISRKANTAEAGAGRQTAAIILVFAVLFHLTLLTTSKPLSNDIYRYYWDGKVTSGGINPYAYSPDAEALASLRDANWPGVMNKDVKTMYPPLAQAVFAAAYSVWPGLLSLQVAASAFNVAAIAALLLCLKQIGLDLRYAIIYAWSPLATMEFANSGHIDSLAVLFMLLAWLALLKHKRTLSAGLLALAVLGKIFPLLVAGLFIPHWGKKGTLAFVAVLAAGALPFLDGGIGLLQGSSYFVDRGLFNASSFTLLFGGLEKVLWRPDALRAAKLLVVVLWSGLLAALVMRLWHGQTNPFSSRTPFARKQDCPLDKQNGLRVWEYGFWVVGAFLLLTPTLHPWYLTWILPFLCVFRSPGWILWTGTVIFARSIYVGYEATGVWHELDWARLVEYVPVYSLLAVEAVSRWRRGVWSTNVTQERENRERVELAGGGEGLEAGARS